MVLISLLCPWADSQWVKDKVNPHMLLQLGQIWDQDLIRTFQGTTLFLPEIILGAISQRNNVRKSLKITKFGTRLLEIHEPLKLTEGTFQSAILMAGLSVPNSVFYTLMVYLSEEITFKDSWLTQLSSNSSLRILPLLGLTQYLSIINKLDIDFVDEDYVTTQGILIDVYNYIIKQKREYEFFLHNHKLVSNIVKSVDFRIKRSIHLNSYLHKLGNYIFSLINECEWAIDSANSKLKEFFLECGERAVNYSRPDPNMKRIHPILDSCPRKWLWRIRAGHKALSEGAYEAVNDALKEWENVYHPPAHSYEQQLQRAFITPLAESLPLNDMMPLPSIRKIGSTAACFEKKKAFGGQLATLREILGNSILKKLTDSDPIQQVERVSLFYQTIFDRCYDLLQQIHPEEELYYCPLGEYNSLGNIIRKCDCKHAYLYRFVVTKGQAGKARIATCYEAALNYCATIIQKMATFATKSLITCAEMFESRPDYIRPINDILQNMRDFTFYFHSGDLRNCTNRILYQTSRVLMRELLKPFTAHQISEKFQYIIDLALGPMKVFDQNSDITPYREGNYRELHKVAFSERHNTFTTIVGQHLSSPLSFPILNAMFGYAFTKIHPKKQTRRLFDEEDQWIAQMRTHFEKLNPGSQFVYLIGVNDDGSTSQASNANIFSSACIIYEKIIEMGQQADFLIRNFGQTPKGFSKLYDKNKGGYIMEHPDVPFEMKSTVPGDFKNLQFDRKYAAWCKDFNTLSNTQKKNKVRNVIFLIVNIQVKMTMQMEIPKSYTSDSRINYDRWNREAGFAESMTRMYKISTRTRQWINRFVKRDFYCFNVGDDHLNISPHLEAIYAFKHILKENMNQEYNNKADYISTEGAIIAEKCIEIDQRFHFRSAKQVVIIKQKQLLDYQRTNVKWLEKMKGINAFYQNEYKGKYSSYESEKYDAAAKAQMNLIECNFNAWRLYCSKCINPSIANHIGGLGYFKSIPNNDITTKHLQNLAFLWRYNQSMYYIYMKAMRKMLSPTKVVRALRPHKTFVQSYPGLIRVPYQEVKDVVYRKIEMMETIKTRVSTITKSLNTIIRETEAFVKYINREILYNWNCSIYNDQSKEVEKVIIHYDPKVSEEVIATSHTPYTLRVTETIYLEGIQDIFVYHIVNVKNALVDELFDITDLSCITDIPEKTKDPRFVSLNLEGIKILRRLQEMDMEEISKSRVEAEVIFIPHKPPTYKSREEIFLENFKLLTPSSKFYCY